jgi:hypothetical protein
LSGYRIVAAGRFARDGSLVVPGFGTPSATPSGNSQFLINFAGYNRTKQYIVTGMPIVKIPSEDNLFVIECGDTLQTAGIPIWLRPSVPSAGFMIQVHQII